MLTLECVQAGDTLTLINYIERGCGVQEGAGGWRGVVINKESEVDCEFVYSIDPITHTTDCH